MLTSKPDLATVPAFYHNYIRRVPEDDLRKAFQSHQISLLSYLSTIDENNWDYAYAEGKWTVKEMVQHIIDAERIFAYRALCFSRKDTTPLPGFDENLYAENCQVRRRQKDDLIDELATVQKSTIQLFNSFTLDQLDEVGTANGNYISVKAIGFVTIGHALHHRGILEERYFPVS
jgi:hypothetical protein